MEIAEAERETEVEVEVEEVPTEVAEEAEEAGKVANVANGELLKETPEASLTELEREHYVDKWEDEVVEWIAKNARESEGGDAGSTDSGN